MVGMEMGQEGRFHPAPGQGEIAEAPSGTCARIHDEYPVACRHHGHRACAFRIGQGEPVPTRTTVSPSGASASALRPTFFSRRP